MVRVCDWLLSSIGLTCLIMFVDYVSLGEGGYGEGRGIQSMPVPFQCNKYMLSHVLNFDFSPHLLFIETKSLFPSDLQPLKIHSSDQRRDVQTQRVRAVLLEARGPD